MKQMGKPQKRLTRYITGTDKWLIGTCLLLSVSSVFFLYGLYLTGMTTDYSRAKTQAVATLIGAVVALVVSFIDYNFILKLWKIYLPICIIAVILTFFLGVERGSNQAWLVIHIGGGSVSVQPSEFLKVSFITTISLHISYLKDELNKLTNLVMLIIHGGAYILLVVMQKDDGTAMVFTGIFFIMLFLAGIAWRYILIAAGLFVVAVPILWFKVMNADQQMRFLVLKDPTISDKYAYQQMQGLKALGFGGITGVGFKEDLVYVPESYNDFIFTFIGQTVGLVGCAVAIIVLIVLCCRLLYNANNSQDITGRMLCYGVMAMVMLQSIMNIGMCINLLPVIGVPLPFLSSGGTSVVALYLGIGLALSVFRYKKLSFFE